MEDLIINCYLFSNLRASASTLVTQYDQITKIPVHALAAMSIANSQSDTAN
jgi:hypothetical protein